MFRAKSETELEPEVETVTGGRGPAPVEKGEPHEAEFFKPSSFASRKAKSVDRSAQPERIVSLGLTEFGQRDPRTNELKYLEAEIFCNLDKPMERWVEISGVAGRYPLHTVTGKEDAVTRFPGTIKRIGRELHPDRIPAPREEPPRPI